MRSLIRRAARDTRPDPAPSRWSWRMQRLMLTPGIRVALRFCLPFCAAVMAGTIYLAKEERRLAISEKIAEVRASIEERPEFMVKVMAIDGAEDRLAAEIRETLPMDFPMSSFDLDLEELRADITAISAVRRAGVRIKPGGILQVEVTPRVPVALWRNDQGLSLIDAEGELVRGAAHRADHADLPLVVGAGADRKITEAMTLIRAASALGPRFRGLVRIGERRWDLVLDRDQRIMLPERGALEALDRVIALEGVTEVLTRDVTRVDLRLAARPTVRMSEEATETWWQIRKVAGQ
ncbi:MAG: cell division protein FtsQ/DivIB [Sulfitobacter sp.]|nr:cell division protein FtsQ/DivIB [Sulfitobacter sp.]